LKPWWSSVGSSSFISILVTRAPGGPL
jgi:hypothetical protein